MGNIVKVIDLTPDKQIREEARRREKRLHDEATALNFARKEGVAEGEARGRVEGETSAFATVIETMRKNGFTEEQIKLALGENYTG